MSDLFHEEIPIETIQRVFDVMERAPQHPSQILTKRSARLWELAPELTWHHNVWMGVSVENERYAQRARPRRGASRRALPERRAAPRTDPRAAARRHSMGERRRGVGLTVTWRRIRPLWEMPTISRFFGIAIEMHFLEHRPPRFHARYGEFVASISIGTLEVMAGRLPSQVLTLVLEWAMIHRPELRENWSRADRKEPLARVAGLDEEA